MSRRDHFVVGFAAGVTGTVLVALAVRIVELLT